MKSNRLAIAMIIVALLVQFLPPAGGFPSGAARQVAAADQCDTAKRTLKNEKCKTPGRIKSAVCTLRFTW